MIAYIMRQTFIGVDWLPDGGATERGAESSTASVPSSSNDCLIAVRG